MDELADALQAGEDLRPARVGGEHVFLVHSRESVLALSSKPAPDDQSARHVPAFLQGAFTGRPLEPVGACSSRAKILFGPG